MSTEGILLNQLSLSESLKVKRIYFKTSSMDRNKGWGIGIIAPTQFPLPFEINPEKTIVLINGGLVCSDSGSSSYPDTDIGTIYVSEITSNTIAFSMSHAFYIDYDSKTQIYGYKADTFNWILIEFE